MARAALHARRDAGVGFRRRQPVAIAVADGQRVAVLIDDHFPHQQGEQVAGHAARARLHAEQLCAKVGIVIVAARDDALLGFLQIALQPATSADTAGREGKSSVAPMKGLMPAPVS